MSDGVRRHRFDIVTDTGGNFIDTGPPVFGAVLQVAFRTPIDTGRQMDTGTNMKLESVGTGLVVCDISEIIGANARAGHFTRVFKQLSYDTGAAASGGEEFIFLGGERLRLTIDDASTPGGSSDTGKKTGTVYVYTG